MSVLVTGLSGFVGAHVATSLDAVPLAVEGRAVDLTEPKEVLAALDEARPDGVLHLAAQSAVTLAISDPLETYRVNVLGTLNLLEGLRATGFRGRLLYVSSGDVYGGVPPDELPVVETRRPAPRNPYAVSKLAAEALCLEWARSCGLDVVLARPFNHVGPGQDERFAVADFARQVVRVRKGLAAPELVVGDVDATRDFTDVRDVVSAYLLLLTHGRRGEVYNVASGTERSLRSVVEQLSLLAQVAVSLRVEPRRLREGEQRRVQASHEKLSRDTGWRPRIPWNQTLQDTLSYWEEKEAT
jgi:GDP-4-dehydro-6-deoxy-D-mannose reductase